MAFASSPLSPKCSTITARTAFVQNPINAYGQVVQVGVHLRNLHDLVQIVQENRGVRGRQ